MKAILMGVHESNPYGHWEDLAFIAYNDYLLNLAGGTWDNPPPESDILKVAVKEADQIRMFIKKKEREPFWGWKDPRTVLTIKCFMPHLTNPHFFCCFRNPKDVAESLRVRDNKTIDEGYKLAIEYNRRLIGFLAEEHLDMEVI
jgi:hypothetical protein